MTTLQVQQSLQAEMDKLNDFCLRTFAQNMGVDIHKFKTRQQIEQECIRVELHAYVH